MGKIRKLEFLNMLPKQESTRKTQGHRQPYTKLEITKINR